jgi:hypothetical protein
MAELHREDGFVFRYWSNEPDEPLHIHVWKAGRQAKFWLRPVSMYKNRGFAPAEIRQIEAIIVRNHSLLVRKCQDERKKGS